MGTVMSLSVTTQIEIHYMFNLVNGSLGVRINI